MNGIASELLRQPEARLLLESTLKKEAPLVTGLSPVHRAMLAAAMAQETGRPMLLLCGDETEALRLRADLQAMTGEAVTLLRRREWQLRPTAAASRSWEYQRLSALYDMASGRTRLTVAAVDAAVQRCIPKETLLAAAITLKIGQRYPIAALAERLTQAGYVRCQQVEGPGQFAVRGGILDVFSPAMDQPVRCEFWDDELDAMGAFDPVTQRRVHNLEETLLLSAGEVLPFRAADTAEKAAAALDMAAKRLKKKENTQPLLRQLEADAAALRQGIAPNGCDRYMAAIYFEKTAALDYLPEDAIICVCESGRVSEGLRACLWQMKEDVAAAAENGFMAPAMGELALSEGESMARLARFALCQLDSLPTSRYLLAPGQLLQISARQLSTYGGSLETAAGDMTHYLSAGYRVVVLCGGEVRARNMQELLRGQQIPAALVLDGSALPEAGQAAIMLGALSAGSEWPALKLAVLTEGQLTESVSGKKGKPRRTKDSSRQKLQSYTDLTPGDLVVHAHHGIGRFVEMLRLPVDGVEKDYIKIAYAGSDCLYVPATSLDLVSKYIGAGSGEDGEKPARLNKLGGTEWAKTTHRAKAAAKELAAGLIQLYAQRQRQPGFAFSPDSPWQQEFEDAFDYEETGDQLRAIEEIKSDMEKPAPMDRLLCGDVGYGKTEVALRAVMKCVMDGRQAAILVPTTVLAQQHYQTSVQRFFGYPVKIEVLSRFRTPAQVKATKRGLEDGSVDIVIGTHALLQKDIHFKKLGLLVVDEEQRFGVSHKERLKEMSRQIDVLTLSATPIPRTLNMALSGIRDMSVIEEPPQDRLPVQTFVMEHDWETVCDAIRREIRRGGQVYYLHNRVENIEQTAARLMKLLPEVSFGVAHGKMSQEELSLAMEAMQTGDIQVLVCTTIIETGIDIPNVNTLIIEDADKLGLAQLHQIRGRVGRSSRRASAYLTFRRDKVLTEIAEKRLNAIREFAEFNSGFKIAMRDLEIRGAGDLLGAEQSGHMTTVGYDMYMKLLSEAVLEEKGVKPEVRAECAADLAVSANIPEDYVHSTEQRMDLYRRIAMIRTEADADDLTDELIDRFGDPPPGVNALVHVALLRGEASRAGVRDISQKAGCLRFVLERFDMAKVSALYSLPAYKGRLKVEAGQKPCLTLRIKAARRVIDEARQFVADWTAAE